MRGSAVFRTGIAPGGALAGPWVRDPLWTRARAVPSLDLRFADNKSLVDAVTGAQLVTFTRASSATYVGSDGLVKSATTNEARFDHNPTTGESLGLLVEEARTNLIVQSENLGTTWTTTGLLAFGSGSTLNATVAPDGATTADLVTENSSTSEHRIETAAISWVANTTYTLTIFAKANGRTRIDFFGVGGGNFTGGREADFNLSTGSVIGTDGSTASITPFPNGWYRLRMTFTTSATPSASSIFIRLNDNSSNISYTGDGTSGLFLWGAQLEAGAFPTSYIPTTTATVTRAADVDNITGSNFSSWYNQTEGTVFSDSTVIASQVQTQTVWQLGGGTILTSLRQPQGTSNQFRALIGGTFTASPGTGGLLSAGTSKAGVAYLGTAGRLQVASSGVDSTGSSLDANKLDIGSLNPGSSLNGTIKRLTYWPVRLANTTLQSITAP